MVELGRLTQADIAVVGCYFIIILLVGLASMLRRNKGGADGFFLAGSTVPWYQVGASVFASNIGSHHFIGLAGTAAASGYAVVLFEWLSIWSIILMAHVFLPVYLASAIFTVPEYLGKRFSSSRIRMFLSVYSLFLIMVIKIPVDLFSGAVFLQTILKWNLNHAIILLLVITAMYTIAGGLAAVVYTETLQTVVIVVGGVFVTVAGFQEIGGYHNLGEKFMKAYTNDSFKSSNNCGIPPADSLHLFRGVHDKLPALGFCTGHIMSSIHYWAISQTIVQRSLAAKNLAHGQGGAVMASWLKLSPMFLMIMPGMISRILHPDEVACTDPIKCMEICQNPNGCTNIAYPLLVVTVLPAGLRGLLTAVMLSALMSSLASAFNSASTLFTLDLWVKGRNIPLDHRMNKLTVKQKRRNELEIMIIGRLVMVVLMVVGVFWIPMVKSGGNNGQLFTYIAKIGGATSSPTLALFVLALFWHRTTESGAFWSLVLSFMLSIVRITLEIFQPDPRCGETDTRSKFVQALMIHYMYFSAILFFIAIAIGVAVSLTTTPIPEACLYRLTFWTRNSSEPRKQMNYNIAGDDVFQLTDEEENVDENDDDDNPSLNMKEFTESAPSSQVNNLMEIYQDTNHDDVEDTEQLIPDDRNRSQFQIHNGDSQDVLRFKEPEKNAKLKRFIHWFLGVSTFDGKPVTTETQEERELEIQKKLKVSQFSKYLIRINWTLVIVVHLFMYVLYG